MELSTHRAGGGNDAAAEMGRKPVVPHPASFGEIGHTQGEMTKGQGQWGSVDTHRDGAERKEEGS